jgi:hypoxanthine phosphoribosyltransferase
MRKEYISQMQMDAYYKDIIRQMAVHNYKPDIVVGLLRGGADMAVKFSHYYDIPCEVFKWQLRDGNNDSHQDDVDQLTSFFLENKNNEILIVDDIFDTGMSLRAIDKIVASIPMTGLVSYAVCIENIDEDDPHIDFSARQISRTDEDQWFVFPCEEWWY